MQSVLGETEKEEGELTCENFEKVAKEVEVWRPGQSYEGGGTAVVIETSS